jgi:hypothetical protein
LSTVGVEQAGGRWRYAFCLFVVALAMTRSTGAQARSLERHGPDGPEGRLLAYYAAAVAFTPAGFDGASSRFHVGLEVSWVPPLNEAQRRPSIDKPEATNLAPLVPRPRLGARLLGFTAEASWIPPMEVFDVRANLLGFSLARAVGTVGGTRLTPRVAVTFGRVRGPITCNPGTMLGRGSDLELYYSTVCHGRESDDWFEPRLLSADLIASRDVGGPLALRLYASAGARVDRSRFDIGVLHVDGRRDTDHPILELEATRPQFALGATWRAAGPWGAGVEGFYAPGSLFTVRVSARYEVGR